jgi:hypothetical protein
MTLVLKPAAANEVEGFRFGMSRQQVSQLAIEKGYQLAILLNPARIGRPTF